MKERTILSIDAATKTGWAIYKNGLITQHGTKRFNSETRTVDYGKWLLKTIKQHGVTHIVAEDIFREHSRTKDKAFLALSNMQGVLKYIAGTNDIELSLLNPIRVKSTIIPSIFKHDRKTDKQRMINRISSLGYQLETDKADDEADAIAILITHLKDCNLPVTHPKK